MSLFSHFYLNIINRAVIAQRWFEFRPLSFLVALLKDLKIKPFYNFFPGLALT